MQFVVFILAYPLLWIISILPYRLFYWISDVFYFLVYRLFGYRKDVVRANLELVFPNQSIAERKQIEKDFFKHMCDMFMEMVKTMNLSKEEVKKRYAVKNIELVQEIEKDRSVLVVCSHFANWEWNVSINNYISSKGYAVYQPINNRYFDRWIRKTRSQWNTTLISQRETAVTIVRDKKNGIHGVFGMVSDQSPQWHRAKYWRPFMGITVPVINGAEKLARKLDLAVLFLKVSKVRRGYYEAEFIPITTSGKDTKPNEITDSFIALAENQINELPAHYLWTHKRWKHRDKVPPEFQ